MSLVRHVLAACDAGRLVERSWPASLDGSGRVHVLAAGKAAGGMARAALARLGGQVAGGLVIGARFDSSQVRAVEVDHPLATERNVAAAREVEALARGLGEDDTLVLLLSGGASAHLTLPAEGLSLEDLRLATDALLRAGATIEELNAVRKHCERLKGGGLARLAAPARVVALVLSDVVGDRLDVIGSGPAAADSSTYAEAIGVIERRGVSEACPKVLEHLRRGAAGGLEETLRAGDPVLQRVETHIVGSRVTAMEAAREWVASRGFAVGWYDTEVTGESAVVGRGLVRQAMASRSARPSASLLAGETTVSGVAPDARGGPAQELALAAAIEMAGLDVMVLSFATDGVDGPTDAAGAAVSGQSVRELASRGLDARDVLRRHDSHRALDSIGALIRIGPTGTNVNDVCVLLMPS